MGSYLLALYPFYPGSPWLRSKLCASSSRRLYQILRLRLRSAQDDRGGVGASLRMTRWALRMTRWALRMTRWAHRMTERKRITGAIWNNIFGTMFVI